MGLVPDLATMRDRVTALDVAGGEMAGFYTKAIRRGLDHNATNVNKFRLSEALVLGHATIALAEAKEWAGLQRAAGAAGFGGVCATARRQHRPGARHP